MFSPGVHAACREDVGSKVQLAGEGGAFNTGTCKLGIIIKMRAVEALKIVIIVQKYNRMDGWMDGRMDGWINRDRFALRLQPPG